jgi:uncharacterized phage-like protein YoqJ
MKPEEWKKHFEEKKKQWEEKNKRLLELHKKHNGDFSKIADELKEDTIKCLKARYEFITKNQNSTAKIPRLIKKKTD